MDRPPIPAKAESLILGAGPSGLGLGIATGWPILEARQHAGGICSSYYVNRKGQDSASSEDCYRFEHGGGHWLFGLDAQMSRTLNENSALEHFERDSAVFFPETKSYVRYPLQQHVASLPPDVARQVRTELCATKVSLPDASLADWLLARYGPTLCRLFFSPFHELYTAALQHRIAPQDERKSPSAGASSNVASGYNAMFAYPKCGLDDLFWKLSRDCRVYYGSEVTAVDPAKRLVSLASGAQIRYERLYSTLPLHSMLLFTGLNSAARPDPTVAVHVLNVGARKGPHCPPHHWVYVPHSRAGFHRVGFYSNVSDGFLPKSVRADRTHTALYIERTFTESPQSRFQQYAIAELQAWGWIESVEGVSDSFVSPAYTWSWIGSNWKEEAIQLLETHGITQLGRYGRWHFQGIADSLSEGMRLGQEVLSGVR